MLNLDKKKYLIIVLSILLTVWVYYPGLQGDFVFDDVVNIVKNKKIQIDNLNFQSLLIAFHSGDAGPLGRPISMLSFALNYYYAGMDAFYYKITNLIIHLLNGLLIYLLSIKILDYMSEEYVDLKNKIIYMAISISVIWMVHPVNLTSVLYIVQRMTSLTAMFGFIAIIMYCSWRNQSFQIYKSIAYGCGIVICLVCAAYSKESGLLFIGLIYWIELLIYRGRDLHLKDIYLCRFKLIQILWCGFVLGCILLIYIAIPYISTQANGNRDFSSIERLLTESRVLFYYLKLIFYPLLSDLSLYHDDFIISKSVVQPVTTLISIIALLLISIISFSLVKKYPLILFAWGWFVIAHLMESTFISLDLVHEHRNYFSSIGFIFLAIFYIIKTPSKKIKKLLYLFAALYFLNLSFTTWQRSKIWSNLVDHALYEATMHPFSDRANHQMSRIYMWLMEYDSEKKLYYAKKAKEYIDKAKKSYKPTNAAWFSELHLSSFISIDKYQINISVEELIYRLKNITFYNGNINFIIGLEECQLLKKCNLRDEQIIAIILAGTENSKASNTHKSELYKVLAHYVVLTSNDYNKGKYFINKALKYEKNAHGFILASEIYRLDGNIKIAQSYINYAKIYDSKKSWIRQINSEQMKITEATKLKVINES